MNNNTRTMDINTEATEMHKIIKDCTGHLHHRGSRASGRGNKFSVVII